MRLHAKRVQICSPYAGHIDRNVRIAKRLCRMALEAGCAPFAPHLLYTSILDDSAPAERKKGLLASLAMLWGMDELWVCRSYGISHGMRIEIWFAKRIGLRIVWVDDPEMEV